MRIAVRIQHQLIARAEKDYSAVMQQRTKVQAAIASAGASDDDDARLVAVATQQGAGDRSAFWPCETIPYLQCQQ